MCSLVNFGDIGGKCVPILLLIFVPRKFLRERDVSLDDFQTMRQIDVFLAPLFAREFMCSF